ncbi:MAG: hypothetical protein CMI29_05265 [Opitutae bacterium]|nr:hypothetical protein [Opitutae bacterium]|tara:strand:+ start:413 stop:1432 length:1020 start_codon:yes stop_codon:yes gene_type:complete
MNLYLSREGQTFGPYTIEQAREYLSSGQFLEQDFALFEGQTDWQPLGQLLAFAPSAVSTTEVSSPQSLPATVADKPKGGTSSHPSTSVRRKTRKISGMKKGSPVVVTKQRGAFSKILSIFIVFTVTLIVVCGVVTGLYFAMPETMGPFLAKLGIPLENKSTEVSAATNAVTKVNAKPTNPAEVMLEEEHFQRLRISGIRILPIEGDKGLQIISSIDSEMAMQDDDLSALDPLAEYIVSLDLTNSKVTDEGLGLLLQMKNLEKLNLEGTKAVTSAGVAKLKPLEKLTHLNLVRAQMDDTLIDTLIGMENLREVYLYQSGLTEDAIARLGVARPKMFVKGG